MRRWVSVAAYIFLPCVLALMAYDWIAVVGLQHEGTAMGPWYDLTQAAMQDAGLTIVYTALVTPRVAAEVSGYSEKGRRICLIMLGLGLAWYAVVCAWVTRHILVSPDLWSSLVLLFVVPFVLAPAYVRWLKTKASQS